MDAWLFDMALGAQRILLSTEGVDLLLTDVVLPGSLTGRQFADAARRLRPDLKILFTSGYTQNSIAHQGKLEPGVQFLPKPFRRSELAGKVREVLDADRWAAQVYNCRRIVSSLILLSSTRRNALARIVESRPSPAKGSLISLASFGAPSGTMQR
jgi:FixJ family two-component response regulator